MRHSTIQPGRGQGHRASYAVTYDAINSAAREISQVALNAHLRAESRRFEMSKVSFKVFTLALDDSLLRGSHTAIYPDVQSIAVLCGTQREEIRRSLEELRNGRLCAIIKHGREISIRVNPIVDDWTLVESVSSLDIASARFRVRADLNDRALQWLPGLEPIDLSLVVADERLRLASERLERGLDNSADQPPNPAEHRNQNSADQPPNFRDSAVQPSNLHAPLRSLEGSKISKTSKLILSAGSAVNFQGEEVRCVDDFHTHDDFNRWLKSVERQHPSNIWSRSDRARAAQQGRGTTWCDAYGAQWWRRWQEDPERFRSVWNDTLSAVREGRIKHSIGGHANNLWTAWGESSSSPAATKGNAENVVEAVAPQQQAKPVAREVEPVGQAPACEPLALDSGTLAECLHGLRSAIE